jgi:hypothetical protein
MTSFQRRADISVGIDTSIGLTQQGNVSFPISAYWNGSGYNPLDERPTIANLQVTSALATITSTLIAAVTDVTPVLLKIMFSTDVPVMWRLESATPVVYAVGNGYGGEISFPYGLFTEENVIIRVSTLGAAVSRNMQWVAHYIPLPT